jgi:cellulose synthase/poly-beta-1,6-N-acetylglucosamine synthase-like glycosyltransferase
MLNGTPTTSVVISTFDDNRWDDLVACLASLERQSRAPIDTIVVVDHNASLLQKAMAAFPSAAVVANENPRGLAGARNTGAARAKGDVVAFIDDDAQAEPDWLEELAGCFADPTTIGAGGALIPLWKGGPQPRWFPGEFYWVVGCSYTGLPERMAPIRNPIGANMALRRGAIEDVGGFQAGVVPRELRHRGTVVAGGHAFEDTDIAIRIAERHPGTVVLYQPRARVLHNVTPERATFGYFVRRCYEEGAGKARLLRSLGDQSLSSEGRHLGRAVPRGIARGFRDLLRGDRYGPLRAAAIFLGVATTGAGFLFGSLQMRIRRGR